MSDNKGQNTNINWFPGHMKKASIKIEEVIKYLDFIILLVDARVPESSYNTFLFDKIKDKPKLIIFTKCDLADDEKTEKRKKYWGSAGFLSLKLDYNAKNKREIIIKNINEVVKSKRERNLKKGIKKSIFKGIVLGIPNVGKSTLINTLASKNVVKTANMPGVTRNVNWIKINDELYIYDTPGILQPHFEDKNVGAKLALIGSIRQDILPIDYLVEFLLNFLKASYPEKLYEYLGEKIDDNVKIIEHIGKTRVALLKNSKIDYEGAKLVLLNDFKSAKIGKFCLDEI